MGPFDEDPFDVALGYSAAKVTATFTKRSKATNSSSSSGSSVGPPSAAGAQAVKPTPLKKPAAKREPATKTKKGNADLFSSVGFDAARSAQLTAYWESVEAVELEAEVKRPSSPPPLPPADVLPTFDLEEELDELPSPLPLPASVRPVLADTSNQMAIVAPVAAEKADSKAPPPPPPPTSPPSLDSLRLSSSSSLPPPPPPLDEEKLPSFDLDDEPDEAPPPPPPPTLSMDGGKSSSSSSNLPSFDLDDLPSPELMVPSKAALPFITGDHTSQPNLEEEAVAVDDEKDISDKQEQQRKCNGAVRAATDHLESLHLDPLVQKLSTTSSSAASTRSSDGSSGRSSDGSVGSVGSGPRPLGLSSGLQSRTVKSSLIEARAKVKAKVAASGGVCVLPSAPQSAAATTSTTATPFIPEPREKPMEEPMEEPSEAHQTPYEDEEELSSALDGMSLGGVEVKLPAKPARAGRGGKAAARAANKAKTAAEKAAIAEAAAARAAVALAAEAASSEADGDGDLTSHGAWRLILPHLPTSELINTLPCVCKALRALSDDATLLASLLGCLPGAASPASLMPYQTVSAAYPRGKFLAEGGYKRVFKVHNATQKRTEAMSVLDLRSLRKSGLDGALGTELWVMYLLSQLSVNGRCPHYLRLHTCFKSNAAPSEEEWGDEVHDADERGSGANATRGGAMALPSGEDAGKEPDGGDGSDGDGSDGDETDGGDEAQLIVDEGAVAALAQATSAAAGGAKGGKTGKKGRPVKRSEAPCFQYVLNEFAEGGDMEEACKALPKLMWPHEELPCLLYQMLFSLYAAQKELSLRHYDVKLLNFFLCKPTARLSKGFGHETGLPVDAEAATEPEASAVLEYGVSGLRHRFRLDDLQAPCLAMLADFGTSDISPATLGKPIELKHYTTLENTPPDFLLLGTKAVQDGKADAFALGLCWLHLLTGRAPYEELLSSVVCPKELRANLEAVWRSVPACAKRGTNAAGDAYAPIRELLHQSDSEGEESVLFVTLYRFLCLFGCPDDPEHEAEGDEDGEEEGNEEVEGAGDTDERDDLCKSAAWQAVRAWLDTPIGRTRFNRDREQWSAFTGRSKVMTEVRRRMVKLPGSRRMLRGLTHFSATKRWSVSRAMRGGLFLPYRCDDDQHVRTEGGEREQVLRYADYLDDPVV